jgi:ABC-type amino acid transport substrate-binding protein
VLFSCLTREVISRIRVLVVALALIGAWDFAVMARTVDEITEAGNLRVVAYLDNAPFSWEDKDGAARGIDVDLGRAIARELGVTAEIMLRMQGEKADDDLRVNIWKGPLTGGGVGDIQMHVPIDREFAIRNKEAVIGNPYFQHQVVVAIHPELTGESPTFDVFKEQKIAVQLATVADYFLLTFQDGALINNVTHHVKAEAGAKEFAAKEVAALMGIRARLEGLLHEIGLKPTFVRPDMDGIVRRDWVVGMGWSEKSRDLGYAVQAALQKIKASGELERIFAAYGVSYVEPPIVDK